MLEPHEWRRIIAEAALATLRVYLILFAVAAPVAALYCLAYLIWQGWCPF